MPNKQAEIFSLISEQLTLNNAIAGHYRVMAETSAGHALSAHGRDRHNTYWDQDMALKQQEGQRNKLNSLLLKFEENGKKLAELITENARVAEH